MGTGEQARRPSAGRAPAAAAVVQVLAIAGSVPGTPRTPLAAGTGTPPRTPRRGGKQGSEGSVRSGIPTYLLCAAAGLLLVMTVGMLASQHGLRLSNVRALGVPAPRLSSSSFEPAARQPDGQGEAAVAADGGSGLLALLSSAAAAVGEQLGADGFTVRPHPTPAAHHDGGNQGSTAAPDKPAAWQLRCAVVNNLVFHIDVMAGWTYAFQAAGCDVTVYQNEHSLGIEDIMSTWLTGRFRKPELFPAEAGDYHIVILPTFRDQHAELIQYLLQLPRLKRQRYFLTQHNPDWLLNHPNVDILQQSLLAPLLAAAQARDDAAQQAQGPAGAAHAAAKAGAGSGEARLLRVQVVTLAPCVSNYTLQFLRRMAFNITEGHTYAERVGSFRVRSDTGGGAGEDDSEALRRWIDTAIDVEVPWMSPLVPWQDARAPAMAAAAAAEEAAAAAAAAEHKGGSGAEQQQQPEKEAHAARRLLEGGGEGDPSVKQGSTPSAGGPAETPAPAPAVPPPSLAAPPAPPLKPWMGHPPPPAPLGMAAISLLKELDMARGAGDTGPRHVCIQGKLENSRRNYSAAFEALSHPAVVAHLRATGERLLLLGHRSKGETVVVPEAMQDVVLLLESLPYTLFFDTLSRCRAIMLAFATKEYYRKKSSSTIATALNVGVPLVAERRTLEAYDFLTPKACFVYDDRVHNTIPGSPPKGGGAKKQAAAAKEKQGGGGDAKEGGKGSGGAGAEGKKGQRRLLLGKQETGSGGGGGKDAQPKGAAAGDVGQQEREQAAAVADPQAGSYSAAILSALRSESSLAARLAVRQLKEEVMSHNQVVAAAFMTGTEQQYLAEERQADAEWWRGREAERQAMVAAPAAADSDGTWPVQPRAGDGHVTPMGQ